MLQVHRALLLLAFIILIYLVVIYGSEYPVATLGLAGFCMFVVGYYLLDPVGRERLTENVGGVVDTNLVASDGTLLADEDAFMGPYQNIPLDEVDRMLQRNYSRNYAKQPDGSSRPSDEIDNSAAIEEAISRGNVVFQPAMQGVSATSSAALSSFNLAEPGPMPDYMIPLNNRATTADEMLARKQQHRGAINKKAIDGSVRNTKNAFQKYFKNELDENEKREWWSAEAEDVETDFLPGY